MKVFSLRCAYTLGFMLQDRIVSFKIMDINEVFSFLFIVCWLKELLLFLSGGLSEANLSDTNHSVKVMLQIFSAFNVFIS